DRPLARRRRAARGQSERDKGQKYERSVASYAARIASTIPTTSRDRSAAARGVRRHRSRRERCVVAPACRRRKGRLWNSPGAVRNATCGETGALEVCERDAKAGHELEDYGTPARVQAGRTKRPLAA